MEKDAKGALLTVFAGICWGLSGSVGQYLFSYENMDSRWLVPVRLGLAGVILLAAVYRKYGAGCADVWKHADTRRDIVIYGLLGISCCQFFYFLAIQLSSAASATILQDVSPVFILLYGCIAAKRGPRAWEIAAVALALAGVALIATHGDLSAAPGSAGAVAAGILSAFCVMIYNCMPGKLLEKYPVSVLQAWAFLMGGIAFALVFRIWTVPYVPSWRGLLGIVFVVLVGNVLAFTCYVTGVSLIGPQKSILYAFAEPVTAALVSALFLHTPFTFCDALGFMLIFLMLVLISRRGH